jgi:hypothetical protein
MFVFSAVVTMLRLINEAIFGQVGLQRPQDQAISSLRLALNDPIFALNSSFAKISFGANFSSYFLVAMANFTPSTCLI